MNERMQKQQGDRASSPPIPSLRKAGLGVTAAMAFAASGDEATTRSESPPIPVVRKRIESEKNPPRDAPVERGAAAAGENFICIKCESTWQWRDKLMNR
jgi:hypothetical protein